MTPRTSRVLGVAAAGLTCCVGYATTTVDGAFGIEFGQTPENATITSKVTWETPPRVGEHYYVNPTSPVSTFSTYYVGMSPESRRVFTVVAQSAPQKQNQCERDRDALKLLLERKYGLTFEDVLFSDQSQASVGSVTISLHCKGLVDVELVLRYTHAEYYDMAHEEQTALDASALDATGL